MVLLEVVVVLVEVVVVLAKHSFIGHSIVENFMLQ